MDNNIIWEMVPKGGLEPPHSYEYQILSLACLPISPPGHNLVKSEYVNNIYKYKADKTNSLLYIYIFIDKNQLNFKIFLIYDVSVSIYII